MKRHRSTALHKSFERDFDKRVIGQPSAIFRLIGEYVGEEHNIALKRKYFWNLHHLLRGTQLNRPDVNWFRFILRQTRVGPVTTMRILLKVAERGIFIEGAIRASYFWLY